MAYKKIQKPTIDELADAYRKTGSIAAASELLDVSIRTLWRLLKEHGYASAKDLR
jgi:molybdenum-dependent DNA-binding transcriptional regulator ModE